MDCHYFTPTGKHLQVSVRYALPLDINPFNDFDIGCTINDFAAGEPTGAYGWNDRDRVYRVVADTSWSYATFYDYLGSLGDGDVKPFEAVTRSMLAAAQPLAHACALAGGGAPVVTQTIWDFGFDVRATSGGVLSSGSGTGSFVTSPSLTGGPGAISGLKASDIVLTVKKATGQTRSMTIRVGRPIDFHHYYGAVLRASVSVVASTDPACRQGATGTLSVSTLPRVVVKVCGRAYLQGLGKIDAHLVGA